MQYIMLVINFITAIPKLFNLYKFIDKVIEDKNELQRIEDMRKAESADEIKKAFDNYTK